MSSRCRTPSTDLLSSAEAINSRSLKHASLDQPITVGAALARCGLGHCSILPTLPAGPCTHSPIFMGSGKIRQQQQLPLSAGAAQGPGAPAAASALTHAAVAVADVSSQLAGLP